MAPAVHILDPRYDTIIILKYPSTSFAPWTNPAELPMATEQSEIQDPHTSRKSKKEQKRLLRMMRANQDPLIPDLAHMSTATYTHGSHPHSNQDMRIPDLIEVETANGVMLSAGLFSGERGARAGKKSKTAPGAPQADSSAAEDPKQVEEDNGVQFHVSSRHLMLASSYFERALSNEGWSESGCSEEDGRFHITTEEEWDPDAFLIVLNLLHSKNKHVPRTVSLEMLAKIAVLVDYYECQEALTVWTPIWISYLTPRSPVPSNYCRDLILWLCTAWVFDDADRFRHACDIAIKQSTEEMRTLDLPIPDRVSGMLLLRFLNLNRFLTTMTDKIESMRCQAIERVVGGVHSLLENYRSSHYTCPTDRGQSFECGSFLFGALTKRLNEHKYLSPRPDVPYRGLSFDRICSEVEVMESPGWYTQDYRGYARLHACTVNSQIKVVVEKARISVSGLELSTLKKGPGVDE